MPLISLWKKVGQLRLCRLYQLPDKIGVSKGVKLHELKFRKENNNGFRLYPLLSITLPYR